MEMSVREARANFAHALDAAERGERVIITKNGKPVAELGPPPASSEIPDTLGGLDWERMARVRKEMGLDKYDGPPLDDKWLEEFNSPDRTREIWGDYFAKLDREEGEAE
ncbi:MAG: type II toxin-antitoxin system prevent-host-death family antitoxin [Pseudomonadota bacterium]|nr:type II toxin-antitoxin system prevent-host-death family antitoxin [Pseudomonadota bacterium]